MATSSDSGAAEERRRGVIVAGWDGSDRARDAVALAGLLARELDARVRVAHAYPRTDGFAHLADRVHETATDLMRRAPTELVRDVDFDEELLMARSPVEGLHRIADEPGVEVVVLGSTHRGPLGRVVPGSVASHLLHDAGCSVAIAPAGFADSAPGGLRTIAAAYDGSREARAALAAATAVAVAAEATLRVVSVAAPIDSGWAGAGTSYSLPAADRELRQQELDEALDELPTQVRAEGLLRDGDPCAQIVDECERGVDLVVMGSRGYGTVRRVLLGSVSSRVVASAPCPVLVVPRAAVQEEQASGHDAAEIAT